MKINEEILDRPTLTSDKGKAMKVGKWEVMEREKEETQRMCLLSSN